MEILGYICLFTLAIHKTTIFMFQLYFIDELLHFGDLWLTSGFVC